MRMPTEMRLDWTSEGRLFSGAAGEGPAGAGPGRVVKKEVIWRWEGSTEAPAKGRFVLGADMVQRMGRSKDQATVTVCLRLWLMMTRGCRSSGRGPSVLARRVEEAKIVGCGFLVVGRVESASLSDNLKNDGNRRNNRKAIEV